MAEVMEMPKLSDTMEEGVVAAWHKKVGDEVKSGELLAEVETDKATMEVESFFDGVLLYRGTDDGGSIAIGGLMAIIGKKGEDVQDIVDKYKSGGGEKKEEKAPEKEEKQEEAPAEQKQEPVAMQQEAVSGPSGGRVKASPLAKAMAKERGIDINRIKGSGDNGRIVKRDIENYKETAATAAVAGKEGYQDINLSQMRKTIARRLLESKNSAPHFYLTMEVDMGNCWDARKRLNEMANVKISFNDIIIKAVSAALREHPAVNSSWLGDKIRTYDHIHIGMAVAIDEGLIVPVIRFADSKSLSQIAAESRSLAEKARNRELQPQDWEGNTFTISNLGMFGIEDFTAIINPPDACILAVGGIQDKPVVKNGQIVPGKVMKMTLSCDHRVVDGAVGSAFLQTLKQNLEEPLRILL